MFKKLNCISILVVLFLSTCLFQSAFADSLVISGDYAFLADGDLKIYNINEPAASDPEVIKVGGATDVAISGSNAVVTINDGTGLSIQIVDISDYVGDDSGSSSCNSNKFLSQYDGKKGLLTIPGVDLGDNSGKIYSLVMKQRGSSMNWEVIFTEEVLVSDVE